MADNLDGSSKAPRPSSSHLFLVRLWDESLDGAAGGGDGPTGDGTGSLELQVESGTDGAGGTTGAAQREWRGKVQHVVSGESYSFQDLPSLLGYLRAMMPQQAPQTLSQSPATTEG